MSIIPLHKIDELVRTGILSLGGEEVTLPNGWDDPLHRNGRDVVAKLAEAWGSGRQFDGIIIGGGGEHSQYLVNAITSRFRGAEPSGHGQIGIALGYARLGRNLLMTRRGT